MQALDTGLGASGANHALVKSSAPLVQIYEPTLVVGHVNLAVHPAPEVPAHVSDIIQQHRSPCAFSNLSMWVLKALVECPSVSHDYQEILVPGATSPSTVRIRGPPCPTAARSMPWETWPKMRAGFRLATITMFFPSSSSVL